MTRWRMSKHVNLASERNQKVEHEAAERQMRTAAELLTRLKRRPGQILADEVGLGKTYTALAVAASVVLENPGADPVVVMVPPALREKWPMEMRVFQELCLDGVQLRVREAQDGVDFLKLLDDEPEQRAQIIFLPSGAFGRQLRDPWVKLALIRRVMVYRRNMGRERRAVAKFGAAVIGEPHLDRRYPGLVAELLEVPATHWRGILERYGVEVDDDPAPQALLEARGRVRHDALIEALRELPTRRTKRSDERVRKVAVRLNEEIARLWERWLGQADFRSPLLILDEAHHTKNPATRLASLFHNERAAHGRAPGALFSRFERMLFLTATPFQLGHRELVQVLSRFGGVSWDSVPMKEAEFRAEIEKLAGLLDKAQRSVVRLDERWARLEPDDIPEEGRWWRTDSAAPGSERLRQVQRSYMGAEETMAAAENILKRWVIRHRKPDRRPSGELRRQTLVGAQIKNADLKDGLDVEEGNLLPFLLAGRAQVAFQVAQREGQISGKARTLFAEGLCSSFEAYMKTRSEQPLDEEGSSAHHEENPEVSWYLDAIGRALPDKDRRTGAAHPKLAPTVGRVVDLWSKGEKVVVFCHFRATGAALRSHISNAIDAELKRSASAQFGIELSRVRREIERLGKLLYRTEKDTPALARAAERELQEVASRSNTATSEQHELLVDILMRFFRSPVVLARYGAPVAKSGANGVGKMLDRTDLGDTSLRSRFNEFIEFFDGSAKDERVELLEALDRIQTGNYHADRSELEDEAIEGQQMLIPTVRLANGSIKRAARRRLLLAFNSPLLPEVMIASSVFAEGVDLHVDCRYVIHHDLDWSPSTLEQRNGRIDRLGSKAERLDLPVSIYMPYLARTQDEKVFRVVRDRDRWFQVVMGGEHELDEFSMEKKAARVELSEEAAQALAFDLRCVE